MKRFVLALAALIVTAGVFAQTENKPATVKKADNVVKMWYMILAK